MEQVKLMLKNEDVDILCVSETWFKENDNIASVEGYNMFRKDSKDSLLNHRNGGSCIYVKNIYDSKEIKSTQQIKGIEDTWVNVQIGKNKSIIVGAVYKHPMATVDCIRYLENTLCTNANQAKNMYVLGDFNENFFKPNRLKSFLTRYNLTQVISEPTRVTDNSKTLIDLIITNNEKSIISSNVSPSIADHNEISCKINVKKSRAKVRKVTARCHKNYNPEVFQSEILKMSSTLDMIFHTNNVDNQVEIFTKCFLEALNKCAPIRTMKTKRVSNKWMTEELKKEMQIKNDLQKELKNKNLTFKKCKHYKNLNKKIRSLIGKAKRKYFHDELVNARKNPKETWNIINKVLPRKKEKKILTLKILRTL